MENQQQGIEVYKAIAAVAAMINSEGGIAKDQFNTGQKFKFRGIDDVLNSLAPKLSEAGLIVIPSFVSRETSVKSNNWTFTTVVMDYTFISAIDGSKHTTRIIGEGADAGDKSTAKAISVAYKTLCIQLFCIATDGGANNDPDFSTPPAVNHQLENAIADLYKCQTTDQLAQVKARYSADIVAHPDFNAAGKAMWHKLTQPVM